MTFRKATLSDIKQMQDIVQDEVSNGTILYRSDDEIATNIRSYTLAIKDKKIVGYGALHIHTNTLAEIRSLIVDKEFQGQGVGKKLVSNLLKEAVTLKVKKVFTLTYKEDFFKKLGFEVIPKESLPEQKIWADCIKCKHFPVCNEVSLIINI